MQLLHKSHRMLPGGLPLDLKIGVECLGNCFDRELLLDAPPDVCARGAGTVQAPFSVVENYLIWMSGSLILDFVGVIDVIRFNMPFQNAVNGSNSKARDGGWRNGKIRVQPADRFVHPPRDAIFLPANPTKVGTNPQP